MAQAKPSVIGAPNELRDHAPVLRWLILNCLAVVGVAALWYFGLVQQMLATDRTHISLIILAIFAVTALHCLLQTTEISNQLIAARKAWIPESTENGHRTPSAGRRQ